MAERGGIGMPAVIHNLAPNIAVLMKGGTQCQDNTAEAFRRSGGNAEIVHMEQISSGEKKLKDFQVVVFPGGFADGDYLGSGAIWADQLSQLQDQGDAFVRGKGGLILGVCNGMQVLMRSGLLPFGMLGKMQASMRPNENRRFESRLVRVKFEPGSVCKFASGIDTALYQVAHGEGRLYAPEEVLARIESEGLVVARYIDNDNHPTQEYPYNPNGSTNAIAAICDPTGNILGLMPHPERPNNESFPGDLDLRLIRNIVEVAAGM